MTRTAPGFLASGVVVVLGLSGCTDASAPAGPDGRGRSMDHEPASARHADDAPRFSAWSAPVNLGPSVNTLDAENGPSISRDGLSLYFTSNRPVPGAPSNFDIYVSRRSSRDAPWGPPENLGPSINTTANEGSPRLSLDGHRLYFASNREGALGQRDLYVARRKDMRDDSGWEAAVSLGSAVNTAADEAGPTFVEDEATGRITMYFESNRPGRGDVDIYGSTMDEAGTFGPPLLVEELSTASRDAQPVVRRDGLEMILVSNRLTGQGGLDLWASTRATSSDPWTTPVNLGPIVNSAFNDAGPALSFDGTALYFHSNANRPGATGPCFGELGPCFFDLYVSTRRRLNAGRGRTNDGARDIAGPNALDAIAFPSNP